MIRSGLLVILLTVGCSGLDRETTDMALLDAIQIASVVLEQYVDDALEHVPPESRDAVKAQAVVFFGSLRDTPEVTDEAVQARLLELWDGLAVVARTAIDAEEADGSIEPLAAALLRDRVQRFGQLLRLRFGDADTPAPTVSP